MRKALGDFARSVISGIRHERIFNTFDCGSHFCLLSKSISQTLHFTLRHVHMSTKNKSAIKCIPFPPVKQPMWLFTSDA